MVYYTFLLPKSCLPWVGEITESDAVNISVMLKFIINLCPSSTLPSADCPYPMLVLTGPQGCGKRELAHRLCQEFNEYFAYGSVYTQFQYIYPILKKFSRLNKNVKC